MLINELDDLCDAFIKRLEAKLDEFGATPVRDSFSIFTDPTENDRRGHIAFYGWWETDKEEIGEQEAYRKEKFSYEVAHALSIYCIERIVRIYPQRDKYIEPLDISKMFTNHTPKWEGLNETIR